MHMTQIAPMDGARPVPARVIRTGLADGCLAHFQPEQYQLVLRRDGFEEKVELGFSGSRLLERLLRDPGEVVPRDELLAHAWSDRVVGQGSLNQQIYTLRQILGDEKRREIIQTLPRRGYMLNPQYAVRAVQPAELVEADAAPASAPSHEAPAPAARSRALGFLALGAPLLLAGVAAVGALLWSQQRTQDLRQDMDIGNKHFTYLDPSAGELQQLRERTGELSARLAALDPQPMRFVLSRHSGFYELACHGASNATHLLVIHQEQLRSVSDAQLRECLR
ncbi:winged helix-turn-helix domain-containing protein [Pseudomonas citronellolis]|uniref:winged helix-turn-helix domain-containing protein n=1 Tax=Pseudomonas citronellolis TaxID=53408 RepID=UPI0023E3B036|nr:winged helix-turn-helix domain-containing protein [Pseudomonas citronellolis]MDF3933839.1 winged helix-turn-helix domain-containing protein [Pseudomonas citronellolis]